MANDFRARLKSGTRCSARWSRSPSPPAAEVLASLGFDWLFIDAEHGPLETRELLGILRPSIAAPLASCACPTCERCRSRRCSISARDGIIVPQVNTAGAGRGRRALRTLSARGHARRRSSARAWLRSQLQGIRGVGESRDRRHRAGGARDGRGEYRRDRARAGRRRGAARAVRPVGEPRQDGARSTIPRSSRRSRASRMRAARSECRSAISVSARPRCGRTSRAAIRCSSQGSIPRCSPARRERCSPSYADDPHSPAPGPRLLVRSL